MKVSAVIGLFFDEQQHILTINNRRGLDVPGGHLEEGEDFTQAIIRETQEEAGGVIDSIRVIKSISGYDKRYGNSIMMFVTGKVISFDHKKAKLMLVSDFLKEYQQDKELMKQMLLMIDV